MNKQCEHNTFIEGKCEWETDGVVKYNYIYECETCGVLSESEVRNKK